MIVGLFILIIFILITHSSYGFGSLGGGPKVWREDWQRIYRENRNQNFLFRLIASLKRWIFPSKPESLMYIYHYRYRLIFVVMFIFTLIYFIVFMFILIIK